MRAGLFNIGAEGQLTVGAFVTAMVGLRAVGTAAPSSPCRSRWSPAPPAAPLVGAIAGALKAWRGAHEVINTIMLNFIVRALMVGVGAHLFEREQIHTAPIARVGRAAAALGASLRVAARLGGQRLARPRRSPSALAAWWLVERTRAGFRLRAVGASPGRRRDQRHLRSAACSCSRWRSSGAVAGLVGANFVLGYKHYYEDGFSGGIGYMGIAVAVLGGARPLGVVAGGARSSARSRKARSR